MLITKVYSFSHNASKAFSHRVIKHWIYSKEMNQKFSFEICISVLNT